MVPAWLISNQCSSFTSFRARQVTGTHLLRIDGYAAADRMIQRGNHIESRTFTAGGHKWRLRFFPNGYGRCYSDPGTATVVELELMNRRISDDDVVAAYRLSVLGHDDGSTPAYSYVVGPQRFNGGSRNKHRVGVLVTPEERQAALRLAAEHGDCLAVRCDITVTRFDREFRIKYYLRKLLD